MKEIDFLAIVVISIVLVLIYAAILIASTRANAEETMKMVIIESPFSGDVPRNTRFARACMLDSLNRGEAPFLSHLLYTQVWDDSDPDQRFAGIKAGLEVGKRADLTVVYTNLGISEGMHQGIRAAEEAGRPIEYRELREWR